MKTRAIYWTALLALQLLALVTSVRAAQPDTTPALREWTDARGS